MCGCDIGVTVAVVVVKFEGVVFYCWCHLLSLANPPYLHFFSYVHVYICICVYIYIYVVHKYSSINSTRKFYQKYFLIFLNEQCSPWVLYKTRKTFPCASLQISAEVKMIEMLWCENLQLYDRTHKLQLFFCLVKKVLKKHVLRNVMAQLLVALWFYFYLMVALQLYFCVFFVIVFIFVIEAMYVVMASAHHALSCLYVFQNITKIYEYDMHLRIDMISYVWHISTVAFRNQ